MIATINNASICWFCGTTGDSMAQGYSIGNMAYCSDILANTPDGLYSDKCLDREQGVRNHLFFDPLSICSGCLAGHAAKSLVTPELLEELHKSSELQRTEAIDRDTFIREMNDIELAFGCWLSKYIHTPKVTPCYTLSFQELFSVGFRLRGNIAIAESVWIMFVKRSHIDAGDADPAAVSHLKEHIVLPAYESYEQAALLRACVWAESCAERLMCVDHQ